MNIFDSFKEVWLCDFEFGARDGERQEVRCFVAREYRSGRLLRFWVDELGPEPPFDTGPDTLFVAYYASAEFGCFLSLGWPMPKRILDLFTEFRNFTNGLPTENTLIAALSYFGLDSIGASEKDEMRVLALRGGDYTPEEKVALLDYCQSDVDSLGRLLTRLLPTIEYLPRAAYRGRYMAAVARMEFEGTPIDLELLNKIRRNWETIEDALIREIDSQYDVFDGQTFKASKFEAYLYRNEIAWPRLPSDQIDLRDRTFERMVEEHPELEQLKILRQSLAQMRLNRMFVGADGRNRCMLSAFRSRTSRNQPSSAKFVFGASAWMRNLIQPNPGEAVAYLDWVQQEFGIAAALSGDRNMLAAYDSGDSYLAFAKQAKAVPEDATKKTHENKRALFKQCVLGVQYCMGEESLAARIQQSTIVARNLLRLHREVYSRFWEWSDNAVARAMLTGRTATVFGWTCHLVGDVNARSVANFPMQANGAEILRLACILATEAGIRVCAPVHDAVLIAADVDHIEEAAEAMAGHMREASRIVLGGFELRTDQSITRYPDHYVPDKPGAQKFWDKICRLLEGLP